jgi:hypothetical protein
MIIYINIHLVARDYISNLKNVSIYNKGEKYIFVRASKTFRHPAEEELIEKGIVTILSTFD